MEEQKAVKAATPVRPGVDGAYLPPVHLQRAYAPELCLAASAPGEAPRGASADAAFACTVFFGPSTGLVNYVPTALQVRAVCSTQAPQRGPPSTASSSPRAS